MHGRAFLRAAKKNSLLKKCYVIYDEAQPQTPQPITLT